MLCRVGELSVLKFRDSCLAPYSRIQMSFLLDFLTLIGGKVVLLRKFGSALTTEAAQHPKS
jgi:hypothetical protein